MSQNKRSEKSEPQSKQNLRLWLRLLKASRIIETQLREKLRQEFASTMPRFDVLAALYRFEKGLKMSELSNVLMVSNGNVTGIVDRLVKDGLVLRVPVAGDRRALLVRLTAKGREDFAVQANAHESWVDDMLSEFASKGGAEFSDQLDELTKSLEERI
ncbi:MAG: MarR family transcriptional regulator [Rhizobiaceae bacterium]|nr:MarR family transcriptional regulator [Rhizobiaceae bacterium]